MGEFSDEPAIDLGASIRFVLANWRDELKAAWGSVLLSGGAEALVRVTADTFEVHRMDANGDEHIGSVPLENGKADIRILRALAERASSAQDILLRLPPEAVLRPRLSLPDAGKKALRGAVGYEIERISPIPSSELYYDYAAVGRSGTLTDFEVRLVKRDTLDTLMAACQAAGLCVAVIGIEGDPRDADWQSFPVDRNARLRRLFKRYRRIGLIAMAAILFGGILAASYERQATKLDAAIAASAEAGARAAHVEKLQHTMALASKDLGFAAAQKQGPLFIAVLAELTQILPDGTWLSGLTYDGKTVRITGSSSAASDLIGLIDRSPKFRSARFEAPIIHDQTTNTDRFDLSFAVRGS